MKISLPKLKAIILYFAENTDNRFLGKVKLMKLFYFMDFMHVKKYGAPITYDNYYNLEHGPIPTVIKNLVDSAADDIDNSVLSDVIKFERPPNIDMYRVIPLRKFTEYDRKLFSENELKTLERVRHRFATSTTAAIEKASHDEAPWGKTNLGDEISYNLAAEDTDCEVSKEEIDFMLSI
jgi:uncharacterized phage-associated protein